MRSYDRGHRILDVICHCGKYMTSYLAQYDHMVIKHPKELRQLKKSGEWDQIMYDWHVHPEQISSKL
jgi:hypothetical protein